MNEVNKNDVAETIDNRRGAVTIAYGQRFQFNCIVDFRAWLSALVSPVPYSTFADPKDYHAVRHI